MGISLVNGHPILIVGGGSGGGSGPAGEGVPTGGTTGQVLAKASNTDYDTEWVDQTGGGGGTSYLTPTFVLFPTSPATTGTSLTNSVIVPVAGTITKAFAYAGTAPTGASVIFDINKNGTTLWSTQGNRLAIAASGTSANTTTFNTTSVAEGDILTIDVDQVGSTIPGSKFTVMLRIEV